MKLLFQWNVKHMILLLSNHETHKQWQWCCFSRVYDVLVVYAFVVHMMHCRVFSVAIHDRKYGCFSSFSGHSALF